MDNQSEHLDKETLARYRRIRLIKKLMRPLPRRATVHRYPILKYFANTARERAYLWEFKRPYVISAIWVGWIIALIPMYGLQMVAAFIFSIVFRANAIIAMLLQWITNPFTIPAIMYAQYKLGDYLLCKMGNTPLEMDFAESVSQNGLLEVLKTLTEHDVMIHIVCSFLLGGFVISVVGASITTLVFLMRPSTSKNLTK